MSTPRIIQMDKYVAQAQSMQQGLNLFGSRKRKKHEARINTQIDNDNRDFNKAKINLVNENAAKKARLNSLKLKRTNLIREKTQLQSRHNTIIQIFR